MKINLLGLLTLSGIVSAQYTSGFYSYCTSAKADDVIIYKEGKETEKNLITEWSVDLFNRIKLKTVWSKLYSGYFSVPKLKMHKARAKTNLHSFPVKAVNNCPTGNVKESYKNYRNIHTPKGEVIKNNNIGSMAVVEFVTIRKAVRNLWGSFYINEPVWNMSGNNSICSFN